MDGERECSGQTCVRVDGEQECSGQTCVQASCKWMNNTKISLVPYTCYNMASNEDCEEA